MEQERLQKYLAALGFGSRRQIEQWIRDKKIKVNGKPAELGMRVSEEDRITLNGKPVRRKPNAHPDRIIVLNKPLGYLCSRKADKDRSTVFELLPKLQSQRWISVGRLDLNSSGLLLFSTDGELVNRLTHPRFQIEREYLVRVLGQLTPEQQQNLLNGVDLDGKIAKFASLELHQAQSLNHWYRVVVKEGLYREVRRLFESQNLQVNRLIRVRYGPIQMNRKLKAGEYYELNAQEKQMLYDFIAVK